MDKLSSWLDEVPETIKDAIYVQALLVSNSVVVCH